MIMCKGDDKMLSILFFPAMGRWVVGNLAYSGVLYAVGLTIGRGWYYSLIMG